MFGIAGPTLIVMSDCVRMHINAEPSCVGQVKKAVLGFKEWKVQQSKSCGSNRGTILRGS